jgi:hypothetical protein
MSIGSEAKRGCSLVHGAVKAVQLAAILVLVGMLAQAQAPSPGSNEEMKDLAKHA